MKILVLGASGFIGSYYIKNSKFKRNIIGTSSKKKSGLIKYNLKSNNIEKLIKKYKFTHAVILAAISNPNQCIKNKKISFEINTILTKKLINKLIEHRIFFIFFSSEYIFDGSRGGYNEKLPTTAISYYGRQKLAVEHFLSKKKFNNFSLFRIAKTYGNKINDKSLFSGYLNKYLNENQKVFKIAYDQKFSALYIYDLIKIIDKALEKKLKGVYNIGGDNKFSRYQYIRYFFDYLRIPDAIFEKVKFSSFKNLDNIPKNVTMINSKIKRKLKVKFCNLKASLKALKNIYDKKK